MPNWVSCFKHITRSSALLKHLGKQMFLSYFMAVVTYKTVKRKKHSKKATGLLGGQQHK